MTPGYAHTHYVTLALPLGLYYNLARPWVCTMITMEPQGFWGSGENGYLFSGCWGNYFRGAGEQVYSFGDLGSIAEKH